MSSRKLWLGFFALAFCAYLLTLVLIVRRQAVAQLEHVLWSSKTAQWSNCGMQLSESGRILITDNNGALRMLDSGGHILWEAEQNGFSYGYTWMDSAILADDSVLLMDSGNNINPQNPQPAQGSAFLRHFDSTGKELPNITPAFSIDATKGLLLLGDTIVLTDGNGELRGIDIGGQELWNSRVPAGQLRIPGPDGGLLVLDFNSISQAGELALLDGEGTEQWRITMPGGFGSSLQLFKGGIWYVDDAGDLRQLDVNGVEAVGSPLPGSGVYSSFGNQGLTYMGQAYDAPSFLAMDEQGYTAILEGSNSISLKDPLGAEIARVNKVGYGCLSMALDGQRQRLILVSYDGVHVYGYDGKLLKSNEHIHGFQAPLVDLNSGQIYVLDGSNLYCIGY
jgi:hypothetical protein